MRVDLQLRYLAFSDMHDNSDANSLGGVSFNIRDYLGTAFFTIHSNREVNGRTATPASANDSEPRNLPLELRSFGQAVPQQPIK